MIIFVLFLKYVLASTAPDKLGKEWFRVATGGLETLISTYDELVVQDPNIIDYKDNEGNNALFHATKKCNVENVKFLIKKGVNVNAKNIYGENVLMVLGRNSVNVECHSGNVLPLLDIFLKSNVHINAQSNNKMTALMMAAFYGEFRLLEELVARGAIQDIYDSSGRCAYDYAVEGGKADCIALLFEGFKKSVVKDSLDKPILDESEREL